MTKLKAEERRVLKRLQEGGYTTIFYATEYHARAQAFVRLERRGLIERDRSKESGFPVMFYHCRASKK